MKRRSFLRSSGVIAIPGMVGGFPMGSIAKSSIASFINDEDDRVLVLIQLNGGNDGLATIIPKDQQDNLAAVRPNIFIPETSFLDVTDKIAFHPNMVGLKNLYDNASINIIQDVGYPNQNRSHFRSTDIWHSGSNADEFLPTGWVGRYLDSKFEDYPAAYPNASCPHPFALTIGSSVSETCQGEAGNFSLAILDPNRLTQLDNPLSNTAVAGCAAANLNFLKTAIQQTNEYSEEIFDVYDKGTNESALYTDENELAQKLKTVARLIAGGLRSKIYVVSLDDFDTHANQTVEDSPTIGVHATLLQTLSDAINAFQDDIERLGLQKRVLGMTYSEFGRRIRSNFSLGTDHGTAAPLILFGSCVNAGIIGNNPTISRDAAQDEGVPMQYDFRSVYGSVLMDWFNLKEAEVNQIFDFDFQYLPVANNCKPTSTNELTQDVLKCTVFPNPSENRFTLNFESDNSFTKISVFDAIGTEVKVLTNKKLLYGPHHMDFRLDDVPDGVYFVRIQNRNSQATRRIVKQR